MGKYTQLLVNEGYRNEIEYLVRNRFSSLQPSSRFSNIANIPWKAIYTTNYDDLVEKSYSRQRFYNYEVKSSLNVGQSIGDADVPIYKINGDINLPYQPTRPLVITINDLRNNKKNNEKMISQLMKDMNDTFIFLGYSFQDGLNCSQSSIMKIASRSCKFEKHGKGLFLCEHRRCYNEIVQYCNELVYEKNLRPLRGKASDDNRNVLKNYLPPMGRKQIDSKYSKRIGTSRQNSKEAEEIVEWVRLNYFVLCEKYRQNEAANQFDEKTILGIITPFKGQSAMIKSMIKRQLPEIEGNIAVGTVHTFQGAERNVIIFSSVYGSEEGCYFINSNKSLMNVAVSRAKDSFLVFGDSGCLEGNPKSAGGMLKRMTEREII